MSKNEASKIVDSASGQPIPEEKVDIEVSATPEQQEELTSLQVPESHGTEEISAGPYKEELRRQLISELDELVERLKALQPEYTPPPYSLQGMVDLIVQHLERRPQLLGSGILKRLRSSVEEDFLDPDTWKGIWYMLNYALEYQTDFLKRRMHGDYETDEWGMDPEIIEILTPFLTFMYKTYWRVQTSGMENIPLEGKTLLVCNHSGQLPWDAAMLGTAIYHEHPSQRILRALYADWFNTVPFVSAVLTKLGQVLANEDNGYRLLQQKQLVAVFPEGIKGVGKLYRDRYRLARFGRGGFVRMALRAGAPMIPVAIVGAEETYISLYKSPLIAGMIGLPFFPITPTWPWLGLFGFIPIPTKWYIDIGEPIPTDVYGPEAVDNLALISQLTDQIRNIVQDMLLKRLVQRRSVVFG